MARKTRRKSSLVPWWLKLGALFAAPLCALNLSVAFFGETWVFPLSPWFLKEKAHALKTYFAHRPRCLLGGHPALAPLISAAEKKHGIPEGLLAALIAVESRTRCHRISGAGAMGPGQLMPGTAAMLKVDDPFEPQPAIDGSARYLAQQLKRFDRLELAVAAYNAGPGAVGSSVPRNGETEYYVAKVMDEYRARRPTQAAAPTRPAAVAPR
ncbi:MAG: lytic transglycosylase domain-containing protein [Myxococcales bacterium]